MYKIQKNLNRLRKNQATYFLDPKEQLQLKSKLKKDEYKIYYPYKDSEKNIFYVNSEPKVILYEIKSREKLRHQDILGSIYSLNISNELFGDILIINNKYYVYILEMVRNYFESNFLMVKKTHIELEEVDIDYLKDYERCYEEKEIIVTSPRIDNVISSLINCGRSSIKEKQKKKEIILNYDFLKDVSYKLKENDIFSIKRIGKFKYIGVLKKTKSDKVVVKILKYI